MFFIVILILIIAYYIHLRNVFSYWKKRGVVGPTPWPIVGNYGKVFFRLKSEIQIMKELYKLYPEEKFVGIFVGHTPALVLRDPSMVRQVMVKDFHDFPNKILSVFFKAYPETLYFSPGDYNWKMARKTLISLTDKKAFNQYSDCIETASKEFFDELDESIRKSPRQNMFKLQERYFVKIISHLILGQSFIKSEYKRRFIHFYAKTAETIETLEFRYCLEMFFPSLIKATEIIIKGISKFVLRNFLRVIKHVAFAGKNIQIGDMPPLTKNILEIQEVANKKNLYQLDDGAIVIYLITTIVATAATTATAAAFFCYALANHSDIQNKCYAEMDEAFHDYGDVKSVEFMSKLKYFENVLEEVLRRHGVGAVLNRICRSNYRFPNTDLTIDPGVVVYIPQDAFREDPNYYPDPDKFIPERFLPENRDRIPPGVHIPFGYGPRVCIALNLVKVMFKMCMSTFLLRYKLEPSQLTGKNLKYDGKYLSKKPKNGELWVNITKRKSE